MPTPRYDPLSFLGKNTPNLLIDSRPMKSIKLDFVPLGSPEINFVLGPSALEYREKNKLQLEPISVFDRHTRVKAEEKISIKHIQTGGPTILVSNKRAKRILKRRKKRVEFLLQNPEYLLPYKFRNKGPKHESRSKSARNRKRKGDGRFAKAADRPVDFTVDLNDLAISQHDGSPDDLIRDGI